MKKSRKKQQTIESTIGLSPGRSQRIAKKPNGGASSATSSARASALVGENQPRLPGYTQSSSSFLPRSQRRGPRIIGEESSSDSETAQEAETYAELGDDDDEEERDRLQHSRRSKPKSSALVRKRKQGSRSNSSPVIVISDDEDEEDMPLGPPRSSLPLRKRKARTTAKKLAREVEEEEEDDDDDDDDDMPITTPRSRRKPQRKRRAAAASEHDDGAVNIAGASIEDDSDDSMVIQPAKRRRLMRKDAATPERASRRGADDDTSKKAETPTSKSSRADRRGPRSEKKRQMELLRRRRRGEKIDEEDLSSSEEEEEQVALYDTDSDHLALSEFEDEEQEEAPPSSPLARSQKGKKKKGKEKARARRGSGSSSEDADDMDDFVVEDDEALLGVPGSLLTAEIPLEFTSQAHKPSRAHFKDAVEWLVHKRINRSFNGEDPVYKMAWRKLDDIVGGLANSKFVSAVWKPDFHNALRARPYLDSHELDKRDPDRLQTCHACGRSNHSATWKIRLGGKPYDRTTLEDLESESDFEDESVDANGNEIDPETKEWYVGNVCQSNADTAHTLLHWRKALQDWVNDKLENDGWFQAEKCQQRDKMNQRKRVELANGIVDAWEAGGTVKSLYGDFKSVIENASNKSTAVRYRGRR